MGFFSNMLTAAAILGVGVVAALNGLQREYAAPGPLAEERRIEVPQGASLSAIARRLEADGVISSAWLFNAAARKQGAAGSLKAGEYLIPPGASIGDVLEKITDGKSLQYRVTVAEGLTSWEVVQLLNDERFDGVLTGDLTDIPPEGALAPNTYFIQRGADRNAVIARMKTAQTEIMDALWPARAPDLPIQTKEEALILASIVEKETGVSGERGKVASVFVNRLRDGWKLQTDPTIIYGITRGEGGLGRGIRRSEINDASNEYNTYQIQGLPPGPIANPGRSAIAAVLNPDETDYYFFVADGTGGHAFSKTGKEHERRVAEWRKIERARKANQ